MGSSSDALPLERPLRLCLFGAAGDTGNLGVSALMHSTLAGVARFAPETEVVVFDNGWGVREAEARVEGGVFRYRRIGARLSRRVHRPESFWNMRWCARLGGLWNAGARAVMRADAVLDISGGDSFADLYGERHLAMMLAPKELALELGRPLVLLPQTYGPFRTAASRAAAGEVLRRARLAWARDERSFEALRELVGEGFDPERHRVGVDVAFALERYEPELELPEPLAGWLDGRRAWADEFARGAGGGGHGASANGTVPGEERRGEGASGEGAARGGDAAGAKSAHEPPLVGINVSGLLWNDPSAAEKYGLRADVREFLVGLVRRFLARTDARVVLVSHVIPTDVAAESDPRAARELRGMLDAGEAERVAVLPEGLDQSETKWVIARLDWFTGARMHATIGAISSLVPTAGLAYSRKIRGVFETCGVGDDVVDLRELDADEALEAAWATFEHRAESRRALEAHVPAVRERALEELRETLALVAGVEA